MAKPTECMNLTCFANKGGHCKILSEAITGRPCPFEKTDDALDQERKSSLARLEGLGREDLIAQYTDNARSYML